MFQFLHVCQNETLTLNAANLSLLSLVNNIVFKEETILSELEFILLVKRCARPKAYSSLPIFVLRGQLKDESFF